MIALLLAGGFAKRLGTIGQVMPKAMLVEKGDTILNHLLRKIQAENIEPIISTNKKFAKFFAGHKNVLIEEAAAEEEKLGAVSAICNAIKKFNVDEDLMVICADNYFSSDFKDFISGYTGEPIVGVYYAGRNPDMKPEEMATMKFEGSDRYPPHKHNFLFNDFKEKIYPPLSEYVSTGVYLFPKRIFPILEKFCKESKQDAPGFFIQYLMNKGEKVRGYLFTGKWHDVSHKSYLQAFRDSKIIKADDRYLMCEKMMGKNLTLSITFLHPEKHATSHSHPVVEVDFFVEGEGEIELGGKRQHVRAKDVITIMPNQSHEICNTSRSDLIFVSVIEKCEKSD